MAQARFVVASVGPLVTIQDRGRPGLMRYGVPASGPIDRGAFEIAHAALGNATAAAAIEISIGGLALDCVEGAVTLAIAGGGFTVAIDGTTYGAWMATTIRAGMRLAVRPGPWGSWTYLAFAGRLQAPSWLGSSATHAASNLGGGRLAAGQQWVVEDAELREERTGEIPCPVWARPRNEIKLVPGPQQRFFSPTALALLVSQPFALTDAYDRMGVRLAGPGLAPAARLDMPSEALTCGAIQVAGDGVATVLLADHQTTGGYPKIATVVSDQLDGFVQNRSRSAIVFSAVTPQAAIDGVRTRQQVKARFVVGLRTRPARLVVPKRDASVAKLTIA